MAQLTILVIGFSLLSIGGSFVKPANVCTTQHCQELSKQLRAYMNTSVSPCDDFYEYACGNFANLYPPNKTIITIRQDGIQFELDEAMRSNADSDFTNSTAVRFITKLYLQCNQNDTHGLEHLKDAVKELHEAKPKWSSIYAKLVGTFGVQRFFSIQLVKGKNDTYYIQLDKASGGISAFWFAHPSQYQKHLQAYRKYIHDAALLMGMADNEQLQLRIRCIFDLESKLAMAYNINENRQITYYTLRELNSTMQGGANWAEILNEIKVLTASTGTNLTGDDVVQVVHADYMLKALHVFNQANHTDVLDLFAWLLVQQYGPLVSEDFARLRDRQRLAFGDQRPQVPKQVCFDLVSSKFTHVLERVYADRYFEGQVAEQANRMIANLRGSFKSILQEASWLDVQTQKLALDKLQAITAHVGIPKWLENSTELDLYFGFTKRFNVVPGEFLKSVFRLQQELNGEIFDHNGSHESEHVYSIWMLPPLIANAAYVPLRNAIYIPTGIIRPPFFDAARPYVMNYGQLGMVIGHELTHGFDNTGRKFDKHGHWYNWWTNETLNKFIHRTECFVNQYSVFDPFSKSKLNGNHTLGENIADNGGIKESYGAFQTHQTADGHSGQVLPDLDLTPEQLYFLSFAWNFCDSSTPEAVALQINLDPHSPSRYRCLLPLRNSQHFAHAFKCPAGSSMNPVAKCAVW